MSSTKEITESLGFGVLFASLKVEKLPLVQISSTTMEKTKNGGLGCKMNGTTTLAIMAGGALVYALAFSGTNFIFGQLGDHGKDEIKRHNLAMEQLSKGREEHSSKRQQRLDYISKTIRELKHAEQTFGDLGGGRVLQGNG